MHEYKVVVDQGFTQRACFNVMSYRGIFEAAENIGLNLIAIQRAAYSRQIYSKVKSILQPIFIAQPASIRTVGPLRSLVAVHRIFSHAKLRHFTLRGYIPRASGKVSRLNADLREPSMVSMVYAGPTAWIPNLAVLGQVGW